MPTDTVALHADDHPPTSTPDWPVRAAVLVHGWCCDSSDWDPFVPELRTHARVITVDLRGHGASPDAAGHTPPEMAADVGAVLDRLGLDDVLLVGHSAGAEVVMQLTVDRPELVRLAAVVDPAYGVPDEHRARVAEVGRELGAGDARTVAADYFATLMEPAELAARHRALALAARESVTREMFLAFNLGATSWHFRSEAAEFLRRRRVPLFAVYRNPERAQVGRSFASGAHDVVLDYGTGHWPHQEQPERFLADLHDWVGATSRRRES